MTPTPGFQDVTEFLPHRPPMLQIDRIEEIGENTCRAVKNISWNEPCFAGHFPGAPIFPGVLTIEAMAQTCGLWMRKNAGEGLPIFAGIKDARFRRRIVPGDRLVLDALFLNEEKGFYTFECTAKADEKLACTATLIIIVK